MREARIVCALAGVMVAGPSMATTVWNPAGNGIYPPATAPFGDAPNWTAGVPGAPDTKAVFNVPNAADADVAGVFSGFQVVQGDNDVGGVLRILNGGSISTDPTKWSAVGYNDTAHAIVEAGGTYNFGQHAWIGLNDGAVGTLDINGGTVTVGQMLGLGWAQTTSQGFVNVNNGGLLALSNIHADGNSSIKHGSVLDITGTGQVTLPGNFVGVLQAYVDNGLIVGNGVVGNVIIDLTTNPGFTTATAGSGPVDPPASTLFLSVQDLGDGTLELAWPMGLGAFVVETATDVAAPGPWAIVEAPVTLSSGQYIQIVPKDGAQGFYRLATAPTDNTTLTSRSMMGYQGWFTAPDDASPVNDRWHHWGGGFPLINDWGIDFYPDMSEYTADERYEPGHLLNNGDTAYLYSAAHPKSVERHCQWMWDYDIDGVFLQRFLGEVQDPRFFTFRNMVTDNLRAGAEKYSRLFAVMYDVSGVNNADMLNYITNDWNSLAGVTNSPSYAHHNGKPVVSIWGLGFNDRDATFGTATAIINFFKTQGMTVKGGVPDGWRNLTGSSRTDPAWAAVYRSFDIISPWTVGRYDTLAKIDNWRTSKIRPDLAAATAAGADYMPVIWPGFSWTNINSGPLNQIPRQGGDFYWRQAHNAQAEGCSMIYTAMFDEVDEGTAMYKLAETANDLPVGADMVPLDADGISLPSDWYLQVGGEAGRMLRGEIPLQITLPITP